MKCIAKSFLTLFGLLVVFQSAAAQLYPTQYRPPGQHWQELVTPHFQIIFPRGQEYVARKTADILENQYSDVQNLTGGGLSDFPVILYDYSDQSNGKVTSLHFRSEIAIPAIKGKTLNPVTGSWLKNVVSHELVHAMQFSNLGVFGVGKIVNIFSPDLARSLYGAIPAGLTEGLAVFYESRKVTPGGGRGNYPWFYNQFKATFTSQARWSLGQMVHFPVYTRPFNRYYIGGYEFNRWLLDAYGPHTIRDANDFYIQFPFLGYGIALLHATGDWPGQLYGQFEAYQEKHITEQNGQSLPALPIKFEGARVRRPKWLSDSTLIFHASFYNKRPGFYRYDLTENSMERLITTHVVDDYQYALSEDGKTLIYSYYQPDLLYDNAYKAELVKVNLVTGSTEQLTQNDRVWAPEFVNDGRILALHTEHSWSQLVALSSHQNYKVDSLLTLAPFRIVAVQAHPTADSLAVIINKNGVQGLWLASQEHLLQDLKEPPTVAFKQGSVFDPYWHPSGKKILFTADFSGVMQIYEYDLRTKQITQLTNTSYNAFEASYSPGGDRIAFIAQRTNEKLPVTMKRSEFYGRVLPDPYGNYRPEVSPGGSKNMEFDARNKWNVTSYSAGFSWLKPRTILPVINEVDGSDGFMFGAGLYSNSLLQTQAYSVEVSYFKDRLWYDVTYQNKQFFPGFKVHLFSEPSLISLPLKTKDDKSVVKDFVFQERSFALSVPIQLTLNENVFYSSLYVEPELRQSQIRFLNYAGHSQSDFSNATIGNLFAQLNFRLQQNIRDVQPSSGLILYGEVEHYFNRGNITLNTAINAKKYTYDLNFNAPTALQGGIFTYISFFPQWNQSLKLGLQALTQTSALFGNQDIVSDAFAEPVFNTSNNLVSFSTRYTIPLFYPDDGFLLIPFYLSNVYIAAFTNTVVDPTRSNVVEASRTVFGAGIHFKFRISNLSFDIGVGVGYEPTRNQTELVIGAF